MKTLAIGSFFVLFAIVAGVAATPAAFADHAEASVSVPAGTSVPGCEETNECYVPAEVSIDVGGEVTWSNDDSAAHTVTSGTPEEGPDGFFDSSLFMAGTTFSVKFDDFAAGDYPYFCMVHPWMQGTVTVEAEGAEMEEEEEMMEPTGEESAEYALSDGTEIEIFASAPTAGETMEITVVFDEKEHANYDLMVTQNGETVLDDTGAHEHAGMGTHMTAPLSSADPVDITVTLNGFGLPGEESSWTGPIGEQAVFTNVVPEFGTIAAMILVVAIVSIIAVTAKSKLSLTPRL
ncbi:MAG: PEFG-CTERM sorting domain-containing protein [Nitrosopumilaceae archaeon]